MSRDLKSLGWRFQNMPSELIAMVKSCLQMDANGTEDSKVKIFNSRSNLASKGNSF